jgi:hypothetical protein
MALNIFDGNSTGFAIRDFQLLLEDAQKNPKDVYNLYCDERFLNFLGLVFPRNVVIEGYPARKPDENLSKNYQTLGILRKDDNLLPCGIQKPHGYGHFMNHFTSTLSENFWNYLREKSSAHSRTLFIIVSGLKPESDEGGIIIDARKTEGARQTFPFENIAEIISNVQKNFADLEIIPISVQYGDVSILSNLFAQVSEIFNLDRPILLPECVNWSDDFLGQAIFMETLCRFNKINRFPSLAIGNASTYGHMLLALDGWHSNNGKMFIAHDSFPGETRVKNRAYWRELSELQLGGVRVVPQDDETPGNWETVTERITALLIEEISRHI